ncbi:hypothetical protein KFE25_000521 [Diacronema lutheri]|uniref:Uncharacterized protein n=1 Tax=Diacronema lutheri TaxID=2081491 RepID=A0A8J5XSQ7_DIALT|nr:hypothetical protein KFE25_000521 [Diacronema lutheri]
MGDLAVRIAELPLVRVGSALAVEVAIGAHAARRRQLRLLFDTGSAHTWGCMEPAFACTRAAAPISILYADGSSARAQLCAVALAMGERVLRNVPFGAARGCSALGPSLPLAGVFGMSPALGGMHARIGAHVALCARARRRCAARGGQEYVLLLGASTCPFGVARAQRLPVLPSAGGGARARWRVQLVGVRLEVGSAVGFGAARAIRGAHSLNETAIIGPLLRTLLPLPHSDGAHALLDTGATHIFAPHDALLVAGMHALAAEMRLLVDLRGDAPGSPTRSYAVPITPRSSVDGGWRAKLAGLAATLAIHPSAERRWMGVELEARTQWVLGMPFVDTLAGIGFASDASFLDLFEALPRT